MILTELLPREVFSQNKVFIAIPPEQALNELNHLLPIKSFLFLTNYNIIFYRSTDFGLKVGPSTIVPNLALHSTMAKCDI